MYIKKIIILFSILFLTPLTGEASFKGALYGKNLYLPHLLTYSFPGFSPEPGLQGELSTSLSYYGVNEFLTYNIDNVALDYESSIVEFGLTYRPTSYSKIGVDLRLVSYYGGFMDGPIELWHHTFGFPNADREVFNRNSVEIDGDNENGKDLKLSEERISIGDIDLYCIFTLFEAKRISLALAGVIKVPTGRFSHLSGNNYLDLGIQALASWELNNNWRIDLQQGVILPGDLIINSSENYSSNILSQSLLSFQFYPFEDLAIITQFRINSSPISSKKMKETTTLGPLSLFTIPQISLQIGVKKSIDDWVYQVYIEEDPISYEGVDILLNLRVSKLF